MESLPQGVNVLPDVNILAIGLTDDHPAYEDVRPWITQSLDGPSVLLVPDYYPLRAQYIMTSDFGVSEVDARNAVQSLLRSPARIIGPTDADLLRAYEISAAKNHDVYDSFLISLARAHDVRYLVTTDDDFEMLTEDEDAEYRNPIPADKLSKLSTVDG
jgi:predicted nucleic acid-binding protein